MNEGDFVLIHHPSHYNKVSHPTMTINIYENHAFLILNINKVTNNYTCGECMARFTRASDLTRHAPRCTRGLTEIACPGNQILAPESAFEKAFYPEGTFGIKGICWLEHVSRERVANTFSITNVATGVKDSLKEPQLMATSLKPKLSFSFMVATGMVVSSTSRILNKEPKFFGLTKTAKKQQEKLPI